MRGLKLWCWPQLSTPLTCPPSVGVPMWGGAKARPQVSLWDPDTQHRSPAAGGFCPDPAGGACSGQTFYFPASLSLAVTITPGARVASRWRGSSGKVPTPQAV